MPIIREVYLKSRRLVSEIQRPSKPERLFRRGLVDEPIVKLMDVTVLSADELAVKEFFPPSVRSAILLSGKQINDFHISGFKGRHGQRIVYRWQPEDAS